MFKIFGKKRSGFTLVEMLIVIVIIGLLVSNLLPKFQGIQEKGRNTVRKANLTNISQSITSYFMDNGTLPSVTKGGQSIDGLSGDLKYYLKSIPADPTVTMTFSGIKADSTQNPGQYMYTPIKKNGMANQAYAVMAAIEESAPNANRVFSGDITDGNLNNGQVTTGVDFGDLNTLICPRVTNSTTTELNTGSDACTAEERVNNLRFIIFD